MKKKLECVRAIFSASLICCLHFAACELASLNVIGKPAWESTPLPGYPASSALDGNTNTFSHTITGDPHPWWKVDLKSEHCLGSITVTLRKGCCYQNRFITAVVRAGLSFDDVTENQQCGSPATQAQSTPGAVTEFPCEPPRMARYVSVDIDASNPMVTDAILMLAEVTVQEYTAGECAVAEDPFPKPANPSSNSANFKRMHNRASIENGDPLSTLVATSVTRCAGFCLKLPGCFSFDYAPRTGQCGLYNLSATDVDVKPNDDFTISVYVPALQ